MDSKKYILYVILIFLILVPITSSFQVYALPIPIDDKDKSNGNGCLNQRLFNSSNVLIWSKLNEASGFNASDDSGNNNHGNTSIDDWTTGKLNNGLNFDVIGRNQSITYPNINYSQTDFSIEFWLYNQDLFSRLVILNDWSWLGNSNGILILQLFGVISFYFFDYWNGSNYFMKTMLKPSTVDWYHYCFTFDFSNVSNSNWYLNGVESNYGQTIIGNPSNVSNNVPLQLGTSPVAFYQSPNGTLDNFIFYTTYLTASEVWSQYNNGYGYEGYPDGQPPVIYQVIESDDPLALGLNETITVFTCDYSGIDYVYFEIDKVNYSLELIGNNSYLIYRNSKWSPIFSGVHNYKIYVKDLRTNIAIYQNSIVVIDSVATILSFTFLFGLMFLELMIYLRIERNKVIRLPLITTTFLFGLIINSASFIYNIPFTPYIQLLLILIESIILILSCFEYYDVKRPS